MGRKRVCYDLHRHMLNVPEDIWKRFIRTLPIALTPTKKINELIIRYIEEYESMRSDNYGNYIKSLIKDDMKKIK